MEIQLGRLATWIEILQVYILSSFCPSRVFMDQANISSRPDLPSKRSISVRQRGHLNVCMMAMLHILQNDLHSGILIGCGDIWVIVNIRDRVDRYVAEYWSGKTAQMTQCWLSWFPSASLYSSPWIDKKHDVRECVIGRKGVVHKIWCWCKAQLGRLEYLKKSTFQSVDKRNHDPIGEFREDVHAAWF